MGDFDINPFNSVNPAQQQQETKPLNISRSQIGSNEYDKFFKQYDLDGDGRLNSSNKNGMNEINNLAQAWEKQQAQAKETGSKPDETTTNFYNSVNNFAQNGDTSKVYRDGKPISANGELDEPVKQGDTGDCWLLSQMNALNDTDYGKAAIKDAIQKNDDGTYTVNLKGVNESYTFTPDEIQTAIDSGKYADGDLDAPLLEMACEKHYDAARDKEIARLESEGYSKDEIDKIVNGGEKSISGGNGGIGLAANIANKAEPGSYDDRNLSNLLGIDSEFYQPDLDDTDAADKALKLKAENGNKYAATISSNYDLETKEELDGGGHEYSIKSVDTDADGNITGVNVVNPWDNSKTIPLTYDEYKNMVNPSSMTLSSADPDCKAKINELKKQDMENLTSRAADDMLDGNKSWDDCFNYLISSLSKIFWKGIRIVYV